MELNEILIQTIKRGASDVHLKHGIRPLIRRMGELEVLSPDAERMTGDKLLAMANSIMSPQQREIFERTHELDMGYGVSGLGRFRINIFKQRGTVRIVIRSIAMEVPSFNQLQLPKVVEKISNYERGLVLVTGVTGCGKTTTMASMIDYINQTRRKHIITIEDPIEYIIADKKSMISQRELGSDTLSFKSALRSALRQDPDVILIGEIRDKETMDIALLAAETGHLVISTLHTADARETINRILVYYEPHEQIQVRVQLATVLRAVIAQRLATLSNGNGVIPAVEILLNTTRVRDMILDPQKTVDILSAIEEGHIGYGMQSFDQSLMQLLTNGDIDYAEALQLSSHAEDFALRAKGIISGDGARWDNFDKPKGVDGKDYWKTLPRLELETIIKKKDESEIAYKSSKEDSSEKKKKK